MGAPCFRPMCEPERTLYDAFQVAALDRGEDPTQWDRHERQAILNSAIAVADQYKLCAPTYQDVFDAQIHAFGHVDYGSKWVVGVVDRMREKTEVLA